MRIRAQNNLFLLSFALVVIVALALYFHIARIQNEKNSDLNQSDQGAYIEFAVEAWNTHLHYTGGRNRMPLFPWLMSLFYAPDLSDEDFFAVGKLINTWLSALALMLLSAAFLRRFSFAFVAYSVLCIAFLTFVVKAPFFQAELLFYSLFAVAFIRALDNLRQLSWRGSAEVGLLMALAHFAKASVLPMLLIFVASLGFRWCVQLLLGGARGELLRLPGQAALCLLAFFLALLPYLQESYQRYGSHMYNVNTTFYVWYDSWAEAKAGTKAAGDREGWPDLPADEIPGLHKYLREHTLQQIIDRFVNGTLGLISIGCEGESNAHRLGYCPQVAAGLAIMSLSLPWLLWNTNRRVMLDAAHLVIFAAAIFVAYALAAAWYLPISQGPRTLLVLIAPFYWTLGLLMHAPPIKALKMRIGAVEITAANLLYGILSITVINEIYQLATWRAVTLYGGK